MKLTAIERIALVRTLPEKGNNITNNIIAKLQTEIAFTDEEITTLSLKQADNMITWDVDCPLATEGREYNFTPNEFKVMMDALEVLNTNNELSLKDGTNSLYNKFKEASVG